MFWTLKLRAADGVFCDAPGSGPSGPSEHLAPKYAYEKHESCTESRSVPASAPARRGITSGVDSHTRRLGPARGRPGPIATTPHFQVLLYIR